MIKLGLVILTDALESTESGNNVDEIGTSVTIKVQDKDVTFHVPQEYLSNNTIDPPTESLRMRWVYVENFYLYLPHFEPSFVYVKLDARESIGIIWDNVPILIKKA